jgi:hypothetical protein
VSEEKILVETSVLEASHRARRSRRDRRLDDKFEEFNRKYTNRSRNRIRRAKFELDCESIELERAAYEAAFRHERDGNVDAAIEWYYKAAASDFSDAAYRLATMLERKAEGMVDAARDQPGNDEEIRARYRRFHALVVEVARWYAEANQVGHPDAPERLEDFLRRSQEMRKSLAERGTQQVSLPWECAELKARAVSFLCGRLPENEAYRVRDHVRVCPSCREWYIRAEESTVRDIAESPAQVANRRFVKGMRPQGKAIAG